MKFSAFLAALFALTLTALPLHAKPSRSSAAADAAAYSVAGKAARKQASAKKASSKTAEAAGKRGKTAGNIAKIRDAAIRSSLAGLTPLKNYSTNYRALVAAVRSYWHRNIRNPSAAGLASTIMRYVQPAYRKYAADDVREGAAEGVASVKLALRNS